MKYKITIIKYEKNENYEAELAKYKEEQSFGYSRRMGPEMEYPQDTKSTRSLEAVLTEEEYKKVKSEVIKIFE